MQTAEYRHLAKREKKFLENPAGRRFLKSAVTQAGKEIGECKAPSEKQLVARRDICRRLKKGHRAD